MKRLLTTTFLAAAAFGLASALPALAGVERAIPASWQGRVKDWLRK